MDLSQDVAVFEQAAARFAREVVAEASGRLDAHDAGERRRVIDGARELGLLALCAPESAGGLGQDLDVLCAVLRPIAREDAGVASLLLVQAGGQRALARANAWPEALAASDLVTWPAFGVAGATPRLGVTAEGRVEGSLELVPFADVASHLVADARDAAGIERLACWPAFERGVAREPAKALGLSCMAPFDLRLAGVAASAVAESSALSDDEARAWLSLGASAVALGLIEGSLATALDYARQRRQGGKRIVEWGEVRRMLADLHRSASVLASALSGVLARRRRDDPGWRDDAHVLALEATERACAGTTDGVQLLGGNGYTKAYPQERRMRDARQLRALLGPAHARRRTACDAWLDVG